MWQIFVHKEGEEEIDECVSVRGGSFLLLSLAGNAKCMMPKWQNHRLLVA
jgi:hypothetical protein